MFNLLFGGGGGMKTKQIQSDANRDKFSDYLPYLAYDPEEKIYFNNDNSHSYIWECLPLIFSGTNTASAIAGLLRQEFPEGTVIQFMLYADPDISPILNSHLATKVRDDALIASTAENTVNFLQDATEGLDNILGTPVRNFRLFFTIKSPVALSMELVFAVQEFLIGAKIQPQRVEVNAFLRLMRGIMNDEFENAHIHDEDVPLRKQIIKSDTEIEDKPKEHLRIGSRYFKCITPKNVSKDIDFMKANRLFGGFMGTENDAEQITTPFLYTLNIIVDDVKAALHTKGTIVMNQKTAAGLNQLLGKKVEEYTWAIDRMERERFVRIIPTMWVFSNDKEKLNQSASRAKRLWENEGFIMQDESYIQKILFLMSLPCGFNYSKKNLEVIDRDFFVPTEALSIFVPIQADYKGCGNPLVPLIGRKGQLLGFDLFAKGVNAHNFTIFAGTGSGKSFFLNSIVVNNYAAGNMIRLIDIGYSYEKTCRMLGGRFIDLGGKDKMCINPFADIRDLEEDLSAAAAIVAKMVYSTTNREPSESEWTLIREAVKFAYYRDHGLKGIDHVREYLAHFPEYCEDCSIQEHKGIKEQAHAMAFTLTEFTTDGVYGRFFNGKSTFNIASDEFVVLELDSLLHKPELFNVATMQVVNATTKDLYITGDRSKRKLVLFEEAYQFLKDNDSSSLKITIEAGYRRARKVGGAFGIVSQSPMDLKSFGSVGPVLNANSPFKFLLQTEDIHKAQREGVFDYNDFEIGLMDSVKSQKPRYSEIFMDTPHGKGVGRLIVDPYTYYVYTSDNDDRRLIESYVKQGMDYDQAIRAIVEQRRSVA